MEELRSRFDGCVVAGVRSTTTGNEAFWSDYGGGLTVCIGLCRRLEAELTRRALGPGDEEDGEA